MTDVLFYQLERRSLEDALPELLLRSLARGWRAVVQIGSDERLQVLNSHLWTFDEASFLPHGAAADGNSEDQPVWLTTAVENPNGAAVRFLVDGADTADFSGYERSVFMFDAADSEAVERARRSWRAAREAGLDVTFWREDANRRWTKQA